MRTPQEEENFKLVCEVEDDLSRLIQRGGFASLTEAQRHFCAIWWLEAEVNNGGFDQYFFNSAGDQAADALAGLHAIGASRTAEILARAIAVFPSPGPSAERYTRQNQLDRLTEHDREELDHLDDEFYEGPDNLEQLLADHARSHFPRR